MPRPVPAVLSIAGSDSGGGAGIQADLKAFARCGVHGMTAITALTAQSTVGVTAIHPVPGEFIVEQVRTVADDIGVDAVKIGMLGTAETVRAVREALGHIEDGVPIVIDPVMVAESGAVLLDDEARAAIVTELLPLATVITPNLPEARVLAASADGARRARGGAAGREARRRAAWGARGRAAAPRLRGRRATLAAAARLAWVDAAGATTSRIWRGRCTRSGRPTWSSRAGIATRSRTCSSTVRASRFWPGSGIPTGRRTGPGARIRARSRRTWRSGSARWRRRGRRGALASEAVRDGHRGIGRGPGPVNVLGVAVRGQDA